MSEKQENKPAKPVLTERLTLTLTDRIGLMYLFPVQSKLDDMLIRREIENRSDFTKEERKKLGIIKYVEKTIPNILKLEDEVNKTGDAQYKISIDITELQIKKLKDWVKEREEKGTINLWMIDLCLKINNLKSE